MTIESKSIKNVPIKNPLIGNHFITDLQWRTWFQDVGAHRHDSIFDTQQSLEKAVMAAGTNGRLIKIDYNTTITSNLTIPANIILFVYPEALITINSGVTLTIYSPENIIAGDRQQIFSGSGTVAFTQDGVVQAGWWGLTWNDSSAATANTTILNLCLANYTDIVIAPGDIYVNGTIEVQCAGSFGFGVQIRPSKWGTFDSCAGRLIFYGTSSSDCIVLGGKSGNGLFVDPYYRLQDVLIHDMLVIANTSQQFGDGFLIDGSADTVAIRGYVRNIQFQNVGVKNVGGYGFHLYGNTFDIGFHNVSSKNSASGEFYMEEGSAGEGNQVPTQITVSGHSMFYGDDGVWAVNGGDGTGFFMYGGLIQGDYCVLMADQSGIFGTEIEGLATGTPTLGARLFGRGIHFNPKRIRNFTTGLEIGADDSATNVEDYYGSIPYFDTCTTAILVNDGAGSRRGQINVGYMESVTTEVTDNKGGNHFIMGPYPDAGYYSFTAQDATPSVYKGKLFKTSNTSTTAITDFDFGGHYAKPGAHITVLFNDNYTSLTHSEGTLNLLNKEDYYPRSGNVSCFYHDGTAWHEYSRAKYETVATPAALNGTPRTLDCRSCPDQFLDPGTSNTDVNLPAENISMGLKFWIYNTGSGNDLIIKDDSPSTILTISQNESGMVCCNGTAWKGMVGANT